MTAICRALLAGLGIQKGTFSQVLVWQPVQGHQPESINFKFVQILDYRQITWQVGRRKELHAE